MIEKRTIFFLKSVLSNEFKQRKKYKHVINMKRYLVPFIMKDVQLVKCGMSPLDWQKEHLITVLIRVWRSRHPHMVRGSVN